MQLVRPFVVAGALTMALVGPGRAADVRGTLPPPASYMPPPAQTYKSSDPFLSGYYVRADLGQRWGSMTAADASSGVDPTVDSSGHATMLGVGAGFRVKWVRADFTVDYATPQTFTGTSVSSGDVTAKIQNTTALLNLYADLGTWYRFTPYVGGGIGTARVVISDFQGPVPPGSGAASHSQWNLAWAAMAGTAFAIGENLQVDVGYRYLNFNSAHSADGATGQITFRNLAAHEVRVGLRWNFDDLALR